MTNRRRRQGVGQHLSNACWPGACGQNTPAPLRRTACQTGIVRLRVTRGRQGFAALYLHGPGGIGKSPFVVVSSDHAAVLGTTCRSREPSRTVPVRPRPLGWADLAGGWMACTARDGELPTSFCQLPTSSTLC